MSQNYVYAKSASQDEKDWKTLVCGIYRGRNLILKNQFMAELFHRNRDFYFSVNHIFL